ncbi:MAG: type VI secretion system baseplate subunit TssE [Candidatus Korobacteraceae bacterium]|jgi:type VI secretion system protein ImpF
MARFEPEMIITQSLLDRLTDDEPASPADPPTTRLQSFRTFKAALRRDLEWLLNTRQTPEPAPAEFRSLSHSLFNYGLPDLVSLSSDSVRDHNLLQHRLQEAVEVFETRLYNVRVIGESSAHGGRSLRFRIEGLARVDPAPEQVSFDTVLELTSGEYAVK